MIRNYFTIAFRSLSRRKIYTLINVIGLSIAMATASFISTWVLDELSFDKFHPKADRIFRVAAKVKLKDTSWEQAITSVPFGPAISAYYPEVENTVRFDVNDAIVEYENQKFSEEDFSYTNFFHPFKREGDR
ncbi:MAG: ABC transporter permease, partial [Bacteroidota bacterium]